jgi:hypothetical protein
VLFGSFSPAFADVILAMNAVIISVVLMVAFYYRIASICAKALHLLLAWLVCLLTHVGPRHR